MSDAKVVVFEFGPESKKMLADLTAALLASKPTGGGARSGAASGPAFRFGKQKGDALSQGSKDNLLWYGTALNESISNPAKAQYRDQNVRDLADVNAELKARGMDPIGASDDGAGEPF